MSDAQRRTARTVLQVVLAVLVTLPVLVAALPLEWQQTPWLVSVVAAAGIIARAMQSDPVERILERLGIGRMPAPAPTTADGVPDITSLPADVDDPSLPGQPAVPLPDGHGRHEA